MEYKYRVQAWFMDAIVAHSGMLIGPNFLDVQSACIETLKDYTYKGDFSRCDSKGISQLIENNNFTIEELDKAKTMFLKLNEKAEKAFKKVRKAEKQQERRAKEVEEDDDEDNDE